MQRTTLTHTQAHAAAAIVNGAPHGARAAAWDQARAYLETEGVRLSVAQLRRRLAPELGGGGRRRQGRTAVDPGWVEAVAAIKASSRRDNPQGLTTADAIELGERTGQIPVGALSESTANRRMRARKLLSPARPCMRFRKGSANALWQVDGSVSKRFYVTAVDDGEVRLALKPWWMSDGSNRKPKDQVSALWVVRFVDDYSGAQDCQYVVCEGESASAVIAAYTRIAKGRGGRSLLRGRPEAFYSDQGSFAKSEAWVNFCRSIGAESLKHLPHNKGATGKVERQHRVHWQRVEAKLAALLQAEGRAALTLAELQDYSDDWYAETWNRRAHVELDGRVDALYLSSLETRTGLEVDAAAATWVSAARVVDRSYNVRVNGRRWRIEDYEPAMVGEAVVACVARSGEVAVEWRGRTFACTPFATPEDYRGVRETDAGRIAAAADGAIQAGTLDGPAIAAGGGRMLYAVPSRPAALSTPHGRAVSAGVYESEDAARLAVSRGLGLPWGQLSADVRALLADAFSAYELEVAEIERIVNEVAQALAPTRAASAQ